MWQTLAMGGYGSYIWAAYGFTIAVLAGLLWQSWRFARKRAAELEALRERQGTRPGRPRRPIAARPVRPAASIDAEVPSGNGRP